MTLKHQIFTQVLKNDKEKPVKQTGHKNIGGLFIEEDDLIVCEVLGFAV